MRRRELRIYSSVLSLSIVFLICSKILGLVEMNSIPFSMGTYISSKQPLLFCTKNSQTTTDPIPHFIKSSILSSPSSYSKSVKETITPLPFSVSRRETLSAFGLGFSAIFLEPFLQPRSNIEAIAEEATATECEFTVTPSGLAYCDKVVGYGPEAAKGQLIKAHYVGKLENGKVFDSSYNRGKPLTFRVGVGEVIKGWDQGILGGDGFPPMLTGGKRKLKIPPELGYGIRGAGCRGGTCIIPPDSVLLFDVEFVGKA